MGHEIEGAEARTEKSKPVLERLVGQVLEILTPKISKAPVENLILDKRNLIRGNSPSYPKHCLAEAVPSREL